MLAYVMRHLTRFVQYSALGLVAFSIDLTLLYTTHTYLFVPYVVAVPSAFVLATSLHYIALRLFVFHDSTRTVSSGYVLFLGIMCTNALVITLLVTGLVELLGAPLYPARIAVGTLFGVISFFLNARYNFKII
jgi:putative flippase GtrA